MSIEIPEARTVIKGTITRRSNEVRHSQPVKKQEIRKDTESCTSSVNKPLTVNQLKALLNVSSRSNVALVTITKQMAIIILEHNNTKNRPVDKNWVRRLTNTINNDEFHLSESNICFDSNGVLTNGQHRLLALKNAENCKTITVYVAFGVDHFMDMDTGKKRSTVDNAKLFSEVAPEIADNPSVIRVFKHALTLHNGSRTDFTRMNSDERILKLANKYSDYLNLCQSEKVFERSKSIPPISSNSVLAAMFVAVVNGVSVDDILHIKSVLKSGVIESKQDTIIIVLRDYLLKNKKWKFSNTKVDYIGNYGSENYTVIYRLVQETIYKYTHKLGNKRTLSGKEAYYLLDVNL